MVKVIKGDITQVKADAIINAANSSLMGGGGVDGAIHRAGGPAILEACKKIVATRGSCKTGEAVITTAGNLPSTYIIHTVGPIWNGGRNREKELLSECYRNSLQLAEANNCNSVAFPNISTGIYSFPKSEAAKIAVKTVMNYFREGSNITMIYFVCFDEENYELLHAELQIQQKL